MGKYIDIDDDDFELPDGFVKVTGETIHIPGNMLMHEDGEDCWCEPTVYRYSDGRLEIHHNEFNQ